MNAIIYKEIEDFPDYQVTGDGRVYSKISNKFLSPGLGTNGRPCVQLRVVPGVYKTQYVHVLVCEAFHGKRPPKMEASHKNGNKLDNRAVNLCWEDRSTNLRRRDAHGTHDKGFNNSRAVLTPESLEKIYSLRESGHTQQAIADELNVSRTTISRVLNGHRYKEVMPCEDNE